VQHHCHFLAVAAAAKTGPRGGSRAAGAGSAAGSGLSGSYLVTALSALPLLALLGFSASQGKGVKGFFKPATHLWER